MATSGNIWLDNTYQSFPDWVQIDFNGLKTINEINVVTQQDNNSNPVEPTLDMTFSNWGITAFEVQYWNGSSWVTVPNGSVTGNNKVWRQFRFANITTSKIRVTVNAGADNVFSRVVEVEAWSEQSGGSSANLQWLIPDHLGTPRIILDQTGTFANVRRHDYLPFGEELPADTGGRTPAMGYVGGDNVRQQFTQKERDAETGVDYFGARYYSSMQGRFTGSDPGPFTPADPQNFNRYSYVQNNPLKFIDPTGQNIELTGDGAQGFIDYLEKKTGLKLKYTTKDGVTKVTGARTNKDFKGDVNKEFANLVKKVAGDKGTAKFNVSTNMTNEQGEVVFMDDNETAWKSQKVENGVTSMRPGNVNMTSIQSLDSQSAELGMALVGHFLIEGLEIRTGNNYVDSGGPGAHSIGLEAERKILSEALGKQATRYQPRVNGQVTTATTISFVYTTVQYDINIKTDGAASVNKVSPPTVQRPNQ